MLKRTKLLSLTLIVIMGLSVVSGAGVLMASRSAAVIEQGDWGAALNSGSLQWTPGENCKHSKELDLFAHPSEQYEPQAYVSFMTTPVRVPYWSMWEWQPYSEEPIPNPPPLALMWLNTTVTGPGTLKWHWDTGVGSDWGSCDLQAKHVQFVLVVDNKTVATAPREGCAGTYNCGSADAQYHTEVDASKTHTVSFQVQVPWSKSVDEWNSCQRSYLAAFPTSNTLRDVSWTPGPPGNTTT